MPGSQAKTCSSIGNIYPGPPALRLKAVPGIHKAVSSDTAKQSLSLGKIEEEVKYLLKQKLWGGRSLGCFHLTNDACCLPTPISVFISEAKQASVGF